MPLIIERLDLGTESTATVILQYGTEEVEVQYSEDKTIAELFSENAEELGFTGNAAFRVTGQIVPGTTPVSPNSVYTATIQHDSKGA